MTTNTFLLDFGTWLQSTFAIFIIYHLSTYFFAKDRIFLIYAIFISLVVFNTVSIIKNDTTQIVYNNYKKLFDDTFWISQIWYWMCLGWFFIEFFNVNTQKPKLIVLIKWYLKIAFFFSTLFFVVDYFFFNANYFLYYHDYVYLPVGLSLIIYIFKETYNSVHKLIHFFAPSIIAFAIVSIFYYIWARNPNILLDKYINFNLLFLATIFFKVIFVSVGLGYKYQLFRIEKSELDKKMLKELAFNKELRTQSNQRLQRRFEKATQELERVAKEAENQKLIQLQTQFKREVNSLKFTSILSQMNPHFIFNSLNSIKHFIIEKKRKEAVFYLNKFSKFIRLVLDASRVKETTLLDEIEAMKLYTSIENIRFDKEIVFEFTVSPNIKTNKIKTPPLILHTFIENAIWHGVSSKKGNKKIKTSISLSKNHYLITVQDNGVGRKEAQRIEKNKTIKRTSFGITLNQERLENFYKNHIYNFSLKIIDLFSKDAVAGTKVELKIPKE